MTDQELKDLVASLAISHRDSVQEAERRAQEAERRDKERAMEAERRDKERAMEADRRAQEAERRAQEADRRDKEADRRLAKLEKQVAKTDRVVKALSEMVGGMSNNQGQIAEEFFYRSFKKHPHLAELRFDQVHRNWRVGGPNGNGIEDEFDLILTNGDTLALFEVKTKAHLSVVKTVIDRKIPNLRAFLPQFGEHKLYAGIASLVADENLIKEAETHGLFLITQQGKHLEVVNAQVRQF